MASFDKYSNYSEETSFSSIIFGADKPILEVEMNEMQQIVDNKIVKALRTILGKDSCVTALGSDGITYDPSTKKVTVKNCIAITNNGWVAVINDASVSVNSTSKKVFLKVQEVTKSYSEELRSYGNTLGAKITNTIKDDRSPVETTKRKVITFTLNASSSVPNDLSNIKYIPVAVYDASTDNITKVVTNRFEKMEEQLKTLTSVANATVIESEEEQ